MLPRYSDITVPAQNVPKGNIIVNFMGNYEPVSLKVTSLKKRIPVYLVENDHYFGTKEIYTRDDLERFLFFSLTVPALISQAGLHPDIIHCHDWHTALIPLWLKKAKMKVPSIFTIHNLAYQGSFDQQFFLESGLSSVWQKSISPSSPEPSLNFMSQGILLADILTTVSPTYASEILTPQYGVGLEHLLNYRSKELFGIINGIDSDEYNPATDLYLERNYDSSTVERRVGNKLALQKKAGLPQNPDIPLIGMVSRLEEQKGIDLILQSIDRLIAQTRAQLVILGEGREHYHRLLGEAALKYRDRISVFVARDERLARLIYGGCDIFLMPSRFEPCGLGQLIAMRYGAIPVVRHTGGLADTVKDLTDGNGNGFVFQDFTASEMQEAIKRAEETFGQREHWRNLMRHNMKLDFSWRTSARKYQEIYLRARTMSRV